jgi:hypothetical protein
MMRKQSEFYDAVWYLRQVYQGQQGQRPSVTKAAYGETSLEQ